MPKEREKVIMSLVGEDGNAFAILGRFQNAARRAGWNKDEIQEVLDECTAGDYTHLLMTIEKHIESPDEVED